MLSNRSSSQFLIPEGPLEPLPSSLLMQQQMACLHAATFAARSLCYPACHLLPMLQTNLALVSLCHNSPPLGQCQRAKNKAVSPGVPICIQAPLHPALEQLGHPLPIAATSTALAVLLGLGLGVSLLSIILAGLVAIASCTWSSLIRGSRHCYLGWLRILAAPTTGRLRSGHWHLICTITICLILRLPPGLLSVFGGTRPGSNLLTSASTARAIANPH
jgi:hypothetical protein